MKIKYNRWFDFKSEKERAAFVDGVEFVNDSQIHIVGYGVSIPPYTPRNQKMIAPKTYHLYIFDEDSMNKVRVKTIKEYQ